MKFQIFVFIILLITFSKSYSNDFYSIYIPGEERLDNFFTPGKYYEIRKPDKNKYMPSSVYLKIKNNYSSPEELKKNIEIICSKNNINDFKILSINQSFKKYVSDGLLSSSDNSLSKVYEIFFKTETDAFDIAGLLNGSGEFIYVVPHFIYSFNEFSVNDPYQGSQWIINYLKLKDVWDVVKGDTTVMIGIVDSGVFTNHSDLKNLIFKNLGEIPNDGIDNDHNGFIDDTSGWDFVGYVNANEALQHKWKEDNDVIPALFSNDHGTHVAGCATAETNNKIGVASIGFNLRILPVKIGSDDISSSSGTSSIYRGYDGILYAAKMGANVINCSWLSEFHNPLAQDVVNQATNLGALVIASAGNSKLKNEEFPIIPANLNNVLSVGANNESGAKSYYTNFGILVDVFAPGDDILSTVYPNNYDTKSGTSMAAPIVSGLAGIIKQQHKDWTPKQIYHQIRSTVKRFDTKYNYSIPENFGIINPLNAVKYNNTAFPNLKIPGISINEMLISGNSQIIDYKENDLILSVKNYLSTADSVNITLSPISDFVNLSDTLFSFEKISGDSSKNLSLKIQLKQNNPFFEGNVEILVKYEAKNYLNYELIYIPVKIQTPNKFLVVQTFEEYGDVIWSKIYSPSKFGLWAIGYDNNTEYGVFFRFGDYTYTQFKAESPTALFAFSPDSAMIASYSTKTSTNIYYTIDQGKNFKASTQYLTFVNYIYMFDKLRGIALGKSINTGFGGELTTDGGKTWNLISPMNFDTTEEISHAYSTGFITVAATNKNRILISSSQGKNWISKTINKDITIRDIAAINKDSIVILYDDLYSGYTTDGGDSWNLKATDFKLLNRIPVNLFLPDSESSIFAQCRNGEIISSNDLGKTWQPVLTYEYNFGNIATSAGFADNCGIRLWQFGYDLAFTDFDKQPLTPKPLIEIAGKNKIDFDSLEINKSKPIVIFIQNSGNIRVNLNESKIEDITSKTGEFVLTKNFKNNIGTCELIDAEITFAPKTTGLKTGNLLIINDSKNDTLKFELSGYAYDPAGVEEYENYYSFKIYPNPTTDKLIVKPNIDLINYKIEIYNSNGNLVIVGTKNQNNENNTLEFALTDLTSGVYLIKMQSGKNIFTRKFILIK